VILNLLVATHSEKALSRNTLVFAAVGTAASWMAISAYGAVGAAAATLATSLASQISLAMLPSTRRYVRAALGSALRPLVAVALAIGAGHLGGGAGWAAAALSLGVYVAAVAALGVFGRAEWRLLQSMRAGRRPS
jgi:O-antigen/teichoic acid export membrane protein